MSVAKRGGNVSLMAKKYYEKETLKKAVSPSNNLDNKYPNNKFLK